MEFQKLGMYNLFSACFLNTNNAIFILFGPNKRFTKKKYEHIQIYDLEGNKKTGIFDSSEFNYFFDIFYDNKLYKYFIISGSNEKLYHMIIIKINYIKFINKMKVQLLILI